LTPEGRIKQAVKKRLQELGAYQFWAVQTGYGTRTLDVLGGYKGRFFGIECKRPGAEPTALQQLTIEEIRAAGGIVLVIDNLEMARAFTLSADIET
jgi:hypothetical protein